MTGKPSATMNFVIVLAYRVHRNYIYVNSLVILIMMINLIDSYSRSFKTNRVSFCCANQTSINVIFNFLGSFSYYLRLKFALLKLKLLLTKVLLLDRRERERESEERIGLLEKGILDPSTSSTSGTPLDIVSPPGTSALLPCPSSMS